MLRRIVSRPLSARNFAFVAPIVGGLLVAHSAAATPLNVFDSSNLTVPFGQIESIQTAQTGAQHYDFRSDSSHAVGVNLANFNSNIWVHENTTTGEFSFGFVFAQDAAGAPSNSASFRFRIVDSTGNVVVVVSDDPGEAVESAPGIFAGTFSYGDNTDGIMVSGIVGTGWTIIIDSVNFGNIANWYASSGATSAFTDDLSLTLGNEYRITPVTNTSVSTQPVDPVDEDGDGVSNGLDVFPCDVSAASEAFAPGEGVHALFLAEDQWPEVDVDEDFNDVAVSYNFAYLLDGVGDVSSLHITLNALALGGKYDNGLKITLPVASNLVVGATRTLGTGTPQPLTASIADTQYTVSISSNLRELFGNVAGQINSISGQPALTGQTMTIRIDFASGVTLSPGAAPYDLFIHRSNDVGHETHRPEYAGSALMNSALFGTGIDGSTANRRFVNGSGLPFALLLPVATAWPSEATPISALYPDIVGFAASAGATNNDFYLTSVNPGSSYSEPGTPTAVFSGGADGSFSVDTSCLPATGSIPSAAGLSCLSILNAGGSIGDGLYYVDPDGSAGNIPFQIYCDMTTDGGGWNIITNNDNGDVEPNACLPRVGSDASYLCGTVEPFSDYVVPAYGMQFTELVWAAYTGSFNVTSYQYMTWSASQTIPSSAGRWGLAPTLNSQVLADYSALPRIRCLYYANPGLTLFGNEFPRGGAYGTSTAVTIFDQNNNFDDPGHMSFTEYNMHNSSQSMRGLEDFQDGHGCGDQWEPQSNRGYSSFIMIR